MKRYSAPRGRSGRMWSIGAAILGYYAVKELLERSSEDDLAGKVALVTGGSRGLGLVIARKLAEQGCKVAICARDQSEVDAAIRDLQSKGHQVRGFQCDVSQTDDVDRMFKKVTGRLGPVDILVNNAGVIEVGPLSSMAREDFVLCMDIMYYGHLNTVLAAMPKMRERRSGSIVNIASIGGKVAVPHLLPYSAAKFAAVGLSEGLTSELAQYGISVTTIVPGLMRTGSYLRANFKGNQIGEAAWFSLSDNIPGLTVSAEDAADQIVTAIKRRKPEVVISAPAKILSFLHAVFPNPVSAILKLVNKFALPHPQDHPSEQLSGWEVKDKMDNTPLKGVMDIGLPDAEKYLQQPTRN